MRTLTVTVGCPGSGKSTWAAKRQRELNAFRIERDMMRVAFFGSRRAYWDHPAPLQNKSRIIGTAMWQAMRAALFTMTHDHVILSDTGLHYPSVMRFINLGRDQGLELRLAVFEVDMEVLLERNEVRDAEHRVPEEYLTAGYRDMWARDAWWRTAGAPITFYNELGETT